MMRGVGNTRKLSDVGNTRKLSDVGNTRKLSGTVIDDILNSADKTIAEIRKGILQRSIESTILGVIRKCENVVVLGGQHKGWSELLAYELSSSNPPGRYIRMKRRAEPGEWGYDQWFDLPFPLNLDEVPLGYIDCAQVIKGKARLGTDNDCIVFTSMGIHGYDRMTFPYHTFLSFDRISICKFKRIWFDVISTGIGVYIHTGYLSRSPILKLLIELQDSLGESSAFQVDRYSDLLSMRDLNSINAELGTSTKSKKKGDLINALIIQNPSIIEAKAKAIENTGPEDDFAQLTLSQLKRLLTQRGIWVEGKKSELIERFRKELIVENKIFSIQTLKKTYHHPHSSGIFIVSFCILVLYGLKYAIGEFGGNTDLTTLTGSAILLIIGIPILFGGYVIHESLIQLIGFSLGFGIVTLIGYSNNEPLLFTMIVALVVGVIVGLIYYYLILLSVFLMGAICGSLIGMGSIIMGGIDGGEITIIAFALVGGGVAISLRKMMIILSTSFIGAVFIVFGMMLPWAVISFEGLLGVILLSLFGSYKQYQN